jgi:hypothetical protein
MELSPTIAGHMDASSGCAAEIADGKRMERLPIRSAPINGELTAIRSTTNQWRTDATRSTSFKM